MSPIPDDYINGVIAREGGYVDHPDDRGGETNFGITAGTARAFGYQGAMQDLPRDLAVQIYRQNYWTAPHFDQVAALDPALAAKLLDIGVNMGPAIGVKFMQRALNVLNVSNQVAVTVDGQVGPSTLALLRAFYAQRGGAGQPVLKGMIAAQQSVRYIELAEQNASQKVFEYGWQLNRALGGTA
ncbi:glycoside hydrolase family 108 protein [Burkholderia perseverans]|uniref:glycoside hydrolase family 108 protein n=1 Tax=Burkholderia perseverans TaxID=2615214 RepID=UPI001FF04512|nr:glycosyl hydrolase 108 family protein [Burkholderia perseverans]